MILTKKQHDVYEFIQAFIQQSGYSPSLEEIAKGLGLRSLATVHKHVKNLVEKGVLKRAWNKGRSIEAVPMEDIEIPEAVEIPLLGRVAAGVPIEAINTPASLLIPEDMLGSNETYALQVKGDSMIEDQIRDGDLVIVEKRATAENGQTVVALVNQGEVTLKRFYKEGRFVRLQPANYMLAPLRLPASDVAIQGVVIGLIRKFKR